MLVMAASACSRDDAIGVPEIFQQIQGRYGTMPRQILPGGRIDTSGNEKGLARGDERGLLIISRGR
jgi:hypothetical protein